MKFSIVIPSYNAERWIEKCLKSVLNQTYKNYEIILVDDMSSDNTVALAKKLLKKPHKIIQLKSKRLNGGSRNEGINNATGDYIINIDCDDWLHDDKVLEDLKDFIELKEFPDIVYTGFELITDSLVDKVHLCIYDDERLIKNPFAAAWLKVVKKELYVKYPFPEGTLFEDRIQNYEMICLGNPTYKQFDRITHSWNRLNAKATTFNPIWVTYRFNYIGSLIRLIPKVKNEYYKKELQKELQQYVDSVNDIVGGALNDNQAR